MYRRPKRSSFTDRKRKVAFHHSFPFKKKHSFCNCYANHWIFSASKKNFTVNMCSSITRHVRHSIHSIRKSNILTNFRGISSSLFYRTEKILNPNWYVRDLYFFKRSQYPQLRLVEMRSSEAFNALQKQELVKKFMEIGKVHLTWAILKNVDMVVQRVVFLHEELMKLPFFPRKALESDLDLYQGGELGKVSATNSIDSIIQTVHSVILLFFSSIC